MPMDIDIRFLLVADPATAGGWPSDEFKTIADVENRIPIALSYSSDSAASLFLILVQIPQMLFSFSPNSFASEEIVRFSSDCGR